MGAPIAFLGLRMDGFILLLLLSSIGLSGINGPSVAGLIGFMLEFGDVEESKPADLRSID